MNYMVEVGVRMFICFFGKLEKISDIMVSEVNILMRLDIDLIVVIDFVF